MIVRFYAFLLFLSILGMIWFPEYRTQAVLSAILCALATLIAITTQDEASIQKEEAETIYSKGPDDARA